MKASYCRLLLLSAPLALAACGDGWEAQKTTSYSPYGGDRTAGSGVIYVRAKMMPKKELKLEVTAQEEVEIEPEPVTEEPEPVLDAEEIFEEVQTKGGTIIKKKVEPVDGHEKSSSLDQANGEKNIAANKSSEIEVPELTPEEYIAQAPKEIEVPDAKIIDDELVEQDAAAKKAALHEPQAGDEEHDIVQVYEGVIVQPVKEILAPNRGLVGIKKSPGQRSLEEIYSSPF